MAWLWITAISLILFVSLIQHFLSPQKKKKLPPGPRGLPILGHFHLLGKTPDQDLHRLARKHGPIMYMRFGAVPTVVISSPGAAELFLKTHDLSFANRPYRKAANYMSYGQRNMSFANYGSYWRDMRKISALELFSNLKVRQFEPVRQGELRLMVDSLKQAAQKGDAVDMSMTIATVSADMMSLTAFGRKFEDSELGERGFKEVVKEAMEVVAAFNLGDYFPYLHWLDIQGSSRKLKSLNKTFDVFMERIIDDHVQNKREKGKSSQDFVDTMLAIMESGDAGPDFDRRNIKALLMDMLLGGSDTTTSSVEWTLTELIRHPMVMKKLQKELEEVVGMDHLVDESHLPKLKYLDCVIRESLRFRPPAPLLIHECMEDCEVEGYRVEKGTRLLVNVGAIGRDPGAWPEPEKFDPERFAKSNIDVRGHDFQLIPFGTGRRGCPGLQMGLVSIQILVAQLAHCFDWKLPNGMSPDELDMSVHFGLVSSRAKHLMAIPSYRLHV